MVAVGDVVMVGGAPIGTVRACSAALAVVDLALIPKAKKVRPISRTQRWADAASDAMAAIEALQEMQEMQEEFTEWRDNLPENLQQSALGQKLDEVCNLDLSSALDTVSEAEGADLPLGFGRD